jgi:hypothetical protein
MAQGRNDSAASHDAAREIPNGPTIERLLDAMEIVESGRRADAVGDGGKSKGYLQLQVAYVQDARANVIKRYGECPDYETVVRSRTWSRRVVIAYWERYAPKALENGDLRELACVHNAGPRGSKVKATEKYWVKVKKEMEGAK